MKIKNSILLLFALLTTGLLSAQDVDCNRELSFFAQTAKIEDYDAAITHYENLMDGCPPDLNAAVYQYGNRMFKHFLENSENEEDKQKYAKAYIENYTKLNEHFPDKRSEERRVGKERRS